MRIHFIGICGYAVSGLALVAKQLGNEVTGSDEDAYPTTTASLIAWILRAAGRNPGFRLGMTARDLGSAAAWGSGREFVFEGDEYTSAVFDPRPKFLHFAPQLAVLTNIDWDHPDVFPDP